MDIHVNIEKLILLVIVIVIGSLVWGLLDPIIGANQIGHDLMRLMSGAIIGVLSVGLHDKE